MSKLVISDLPDSSFKGKRVFVRVDFNVPIRDGAISEDYRIRRVIPTIDYLIDKEAKIIVASHLGRPGGRVTHALSLKPVASRLSELLGMSVKFTPTKVIGEEVRAEVEKLKNGEVMMLDNLRFHKEETDNDPAFAEELASFADIYVNDAFGTSHRKHASTYGVAQHFDLKAAGFLVNRELKFLSNLRDNPEHPLIVIVGGAKIKDKISALKNLLEKADKVLIGGGIAYTFLKASGVNIGHSIREDEMVEWATWALKNYSNKIFLPTDHVVAENFERKTCMVVDTEIPDEYQGFDIGPKTLSKFTSLLHGTRTIFWNGPMGVFEADNFSSGTTHLARALALATWRGATTVIGGGETIAAIRKAEVLDLEIGHISTGGGASLKFLGGEELPGITILNERNN